jgi:hypothetical protein
MELLYAYKPSTLLHSILTIYPLFGFTDDLDMDKGVVWLQCLWLGK